MNNTNRNNLYAPMECATGCDKKTSPIDQVLMEIREGLDRLRYTTSMIGEKTEKIRVLLPCPDDSPKENHKDESLLEGELRSILCHITSETNRLERVCAEIQL